MSKQVGRMSQSANDFLEPKAPINVVATDVGTNRAFNNGAASVAFELPADSPAASSYTATSALCLLRRFFPLKSQVCLRARLAMLPSSL